MGGTQSQEVDRFINEYVNTSFLSEVISRYASRTDAINRNTQNFYLDIDARDIEGDIDVSQRIVSVIDVRQLVNRSDTTSLTNDIQQAVTNELSSALKRKTEGLVLNPSQQKIVDRVDTNLSTYVRNTITTSTVDELLISSDNIQGQRIVINAQDIRGNLTFNQEIQADIIARNMVETTINRIIRNEDIQDLTNVIEGTTEEETKGLDLGALSGKLLLLLGGVAAMIIGILMAIYLPIGIKGKVVAGGLGILLGLGGIIAFFVL